MADRLAPLRRLSGAFAMVALDQRESLRTMLAAQDRGSPVPDEAVSAFKVEAARALAPFASAVLLDVDTGLAAVQRAGAIAPGCGLIVAADRLVQQPGGPVERTEVDADALADEAVAAVADAWKLLVICRPGKENERARVVTAFLEACRSSDRPAIVEGIVRGPDDGPLDLGEHVERVVDAARELAGLGPDLYKAEVPTLGAADDDVIHAASTRLTAAIDCPWVVLSNGTPPDRFPTACVAAVRGGASGFLAGRAIWTPSLAAPDRARHLRDVAAPRLAALARAVDEPIAARASA